MAETLAHRGPDADGVWADAAAGVAFGFRRLAIIDLSAEGRQPMRSPDGRYTLVLNGEIYNFQDLRREMETLGVRFRGHSDTEVLLAVVARYGVSAAVRRLNGMFAFAIWDAELRTLHLVRDRLGEKPLYYGWSGQTFLFGSELKALVANPAFRRHIDRASIALYFEHGYVPTPGSIYSGIRKLLPGTILSIQWDAVPGVLPEPVAYWSALEAAVRGLEEPLDGDESEIAAALEELLAGAVRSQMISDVPLGAFLSGGIDSSTIVALMQAQSAEPIKTFTIGFEDPRYDESLSARAVARHLGTAHTELVLTARDVWDAIPLLPALYDEPFADSSALPTFMVSRLARRSVTVSLSGDGGDELFGGYNRYLVASPRMRTLARLPRRLRRGVAAGLQAVSPSVWDLLATSTGRLPHAPRYRRVGEKLHKLSGALVADDEVAAYQSLMRLWPGSSPVLGVEAPAVPLDGFRDRLQAPLDQLMYLDLVTYLPDDILVKLDRAAMGVGLESRVPLLDHRVVEFAWRIPRQFKLRAGTGKVILRQVLDRYVPRTLVDRPKTGFAVQIDTWLRDPLRGWAEDLLDEGRLAREGLLDPQLVRRRWREHLAGTRNWADAIWGVLMLEAWLASVA
jgi:asparagine synthase (glutamine-hydrolysing)